MSEVFDRIRESAEKAKNMRAMQLERFHVGDTVYPLYQEWHPILWGTVVDVDYNIHKVIVNIDGIERQYEPNEILPAPKDVEGKPESYDASEHNVELAFQMRRAGMNARAILENKNSK